MFSSAGNVFSSQGCHNKAANTVLKLNLCVCMLSHCSRVQLFVTLWTVACQVPLSMRFSRQEYWSGLICPPPGDLPDPGIEPVSPVSPALQEDSLPTEPPGKPKLNTIEIYFLCCGGLNPKSRC